ncbi:MAG TPA: hypothetical protein VN648_15365 [Candidatus Methylomirabilis sp.]|jgi:hypothetical protein|nr:hypothetical protein [Candidatus Methylomirabilis sp.]
MEEDKIRSAILDAFEVSLDAQLRALRRLKQGKRERPRARKGMSQVDMAYDILRRAGQPLHVSALLDRIEAVHGQRLDRESLVSALVKKVQRGDRFIRTDKNVFALLKGGQ